jgi:flagellar biosynthesis/type III secretory pathway protein FliH
VIEPPKPPPGPDIRTLTASIRAEFEAKEAIRNREHSTALAQLEQLKAEEQALLTRLSHLSSHLEQARQQLLGQFRQGAGQLILEAARKIAGDGLKNQPELLDKMVQDATDALGKKGLVLYIGAIDSARLMDALENSGIAVEVDFSIEGGLRAETTAGRLDATLETALAAVADVISQWQQTNDRL